MTGETVWGAINRASCPIAATVGLLANFVFGRSPGGATMSENRTGMLSLSGRKVRG
jgi:hypothetical protein